MLLSFLFIFAEISVDVGCSNNVTFHTNKSLNDSSAGNLNVSKDVLWQKSVQPKMISSELSMYNQKLLNSAFLLLRLKPIRSADPILSTRKQSDLEMNVQSTTFLPSNRLPFQTSPSILLPLISPFSPSSELSRSSLIPPSPSLPTWSSSVPSRSLSIPPPSPSIQTWSSSLPSAISSIPPTSALPSVQTASSLKKFKQRTLNPSSKPSNIFQKLFKDILHDYGLLSDDSKNAFLTNKMLEERPRSTNPLSDGLKTSLNRQKNNKYWLPFLPLLVHSTTSFQESIGGTINGRSLKISNDSLFRDFGLKAKGLLEEAPATRVINKRSLPDFLKHLFPKGKPTISSNKSSTTPRTFQTTEKPNSTATQTVAQQNSANSSSTAIAVSVGEIVVFILQLTDTTSPSPSAEDEPKPGISPSQDNSSFPHHSSPPIITTSILILSVLSKIF